MTRFEISVLGLGVWGPGFTNWEALQTIFAGTKSDVEFTAPKPTKMPANERRRAPLQVKLAVETSSQACNMAGLPADELLNVFGSGIGDTDTTDYMCRTLLSEEKLLSPTRFHNSVHNAAAGYWTISSNCMQAANSIAAFELTVPLCLIEASIQANQENKPVLVTLFDTPVAPIIRAMLPCDQAFSCALVIVPAAHPFFEKGQKLSLLIEEKFSSWPDLPYPILQNLYTHNFSARALALLALLNSNEESEITFPFAKTRRLRIRKAAE